MQYAGTPLGSQQIYQTEIEKILSQMLKTPPPGVVVPTGVNLDQVATVLSQWWPYLNTPPNTINFPQIDPANPQAIITWIQGNLPTALPSLNSLIQSAASYINAVGSLPYMPWDKLPWKWLLNGGIEKIVTAFKTTPGAIPDAIKLAIQIASIPMGSSTPGWVSGPTPAKDALGTTGPGFYEPPVLPGVDWTKDPYKKILDWIKSAGAEIFKGDPWPVLYWIVTTPAAVEHIDRLPRIYADLKCFTTPCYGDGVANFKKFMTSDNYQDNWCKDLPCNKDGTAKCQATGQSCDASNKCCDGSECKEGKCTEKSSNYGWIALGVLGAVAAVAAVGFVMTGKSAKANPCPREARNPRRGGLNNSEREQWIDNDEGLYNWWRSSRLSKREFIKQNRDEIDAAINRVLAPARPRQWWE